LNSARFECFGNPPKSQEEMDWPVRYWSSPYFRNSILQCLWRHAQSTCPSKRAKLFICAHELRNVTASIILPEACPSDVLLFGYIKMAMRILNVI
jgi:hypothetical protein